MAADVTVAAVLQQKESALWSLSLSHIHQVISDDKPGVRPECDYSHLDH